MEIVTHIGFMCHGQHAKDTAGEKRQQTRGNCGKHSERQEKSRRKSHKKSAKTNELENYEIPLTRLINLSVYLHRRHLCRKRNKKGMKS